MVQCLLRHGAGWCEDGVGDLLCSAVGMECSDIKCGSVCEMYFPMYSQARASVLGSKSNLFSEVKMRWKLAASFLHNLFSKHLVLCM